MPLTGMFVKSRLKREWVKPLNYKAWSAALEKGRRDFVASRVSVAETALELKLANLHEFVRHSHKARYVDPQARTLTWEHENALRAQLKELARFKKKHLL